MRRAVAILVAVVVLAGAALALTRLSLIPAVVATPRPTADTPSATSAGPSASPPQSFSPTQSAKPSASVAPTLRVSAVGAIPTEFHYTDTTARLLLIDPENQKASEVLQYDGHGQPRGVEFSASTDGRTLALIVHPSDTVGTIMVVRPETGDVRTVFEQEGIRGPALSPDGKTLAYQRFSSDASIHGLWAIDLAGGAPQRLVADEPQRVGSPPRPIAWSSDGRWLAVVTNPGIPGADAVAAIDVTAGATRFNAASSSFTGGLARVGPSGSSADWKERRLIVTSSRGAFGGRAEIGEFDVAAVATRILYTPASDRNLFGAIWRPGSETYVVIEGTFPGTPGSTLDVWLRGLDGSARRVFQSGFISEVWWSRDGSKLYARTGGDDSTGGIREILSGAGFPICLRGGSAPPCV